MPSERLFWLSDQQWSAIEPHLPKNQPGARRVDDRRVISGIVHVLKTGCRWCDVPREYGPPTTIYSTRLVTTAFGPFLLPRSQEKFSCAAAEEPLGWDGRAIIDGARWW